jgi:hypothetical protein
MKQVKEETEAALKVAAEDMKRYYDARHRPEEFKPDDNIWLNPKDLMTKMTIDHDAIQKNSVINA